MTYDPLKTNPNLAAVVNRIDGKTPQIEEGPDLGWAANIGKGAAATELFNRADVMADLRQFYKERDGYAPSSDDDIISRFWNDRTISNMNTVGLARDLSDSYKFSPEQAARQARIQRLYDALPNFYESGGRGLTGLAHNIGVAAIDPLNAIGLVSGGVTGAAARMAAAKAAKSQITKTVAAGGRAAAFKAARGKIVRNAMLEGAKSGAKVEALAGGVTTGAQSVLSQMRNQELGLQDEFSTGQLIADTASGAALGGIMGGAFGAVGGAIGGKAAGAISKTREDLFGNFSQKYTEPQADIPNIGVAENVENQAAGTEIPKQAEDDLKTTQYVAAQREQYKRNLEATIDEIRRESGEKSLAEWRAGQIKDTDKTPMMKQADILQDGRAALEELYKWPTMRQALQRQLEAISVNENPKPETVSRINDLNDKITRGDDAYDAIRRAAGDGQEEIFDKTIMDFSTTMKPKDFQSATVGAFSAESAVGQGGVAPAPSAPSATPEPIQLTPLDDKALAEADQATITTELEKVDAAKASNAPVDPVYEQAVRTRYKDLSGSDWTPKAPEAIVETPEPAPQPATGATSGDISEAMASINKRYNALSNQMARIRKTIDNGKAAPGAAERLSKISAERDQLTVERAQLKERLAEATKIEQEVNEPVTPIIRTAEAEAADAPLDAEGAARYLSSYGLPEKLVQKELGAFLKSGAPKTRAARAALVRQFVAQKIQYVRSVAHLEKIFDSYTETAAYVPSAMRKLIEMSDAIPEAAKPDVMARYNEWLEFNSQALLTKYVTENADLEIDDILAMIRSNHGDDMAELISGQLDTPTADDFIQFMGAKKPETPGWEKLTSAQKKQINDKLAYARQRLSTMLGSKMLSPSRIDGMLELQKQNMVIEAIYADLEKAFGQSSLRSSSKYFNAPVIVDPTTKGTVSGRVWERPSPDPETGAVPKQAVVDTSKGDRYGLQAMLKKGTGGLAKGVDEYGDLVIEYPYFGTLLVRDIVRAGDGSIDFIKTTEGKYVQKVLPDGRIINIPRRYDAAESARRANEKAMMARATNRTTTAKEDMPGITAGEKVTQKQLTAAQIEQQRASSARADLNKKKSAAPMDDAAEEANKQIRESVRVAVINDALRSATETAQQNPSRAIKENIQAADNYFGEQIPLEEIEKVWGSIEAEDRAISLEAVRSQRIKEAYAAYQSHNDASAFAKAIRDIDAQTSPQAAKPKPHPDKPAGAKHEPRIYVYKGVEVDVRNHFQYKKTSDNTYSVSFFGEKVADLKTSKDGTATLLYTDTGGLQASAKASTMDAMAQHLPRVFGERIEAAARAGKLSRSVDQITDGVYPVDWKTSNTWGKQKRTVPVEIKVEEAAAVSGPITDWKTNPDTSAINIDIPDGHVMAVHILEGEFQGVTRVENVKSSTPQTVAKILGNQKTKKYTVGYVPEGTRSASRDATRVFKPLDAQDSVYRSGSPENSSAKGKTPTIEPDEIGQIKLEDTPKIPIDENDLPIQFRGKGLTTLAKIQNAITELENVPWQRIPTIEQHAQFVKDISALYDVRTKYAPEGIKLPTASRIRSMAQWQKIMSSHGDVNVSTGLNILHRLSNMDRELPIIGAQDMTEKAGGYALPITSSDNANRIFLNPEALNPDGKGAVLPQPVALLHEIGHWSYMNILSDADRRDFWKSLSKYYDNGQLNLDAVRKKLPGIDPSGEILSPAELFANQFTQWSITGGKVNNIPLWTKMARKIVEIARAFGVKFTGDSAFIDDGLVDIDQDLSKLFAKILPENDAMYDRYVNLYKTLEDIRKIKGATNMRTASVAAKALVDFDGMRKKIDDAVQTGSPYEIENALDEIHKDLYGKIGGNKGAQRHRPTKGANTGGKRLRLFDGAKNWKGKPFYSTAQARRAAMAAHYEWRNFQKEMYADRGSMGSAADELSTSSLDENTASGDLASSFDVTADRAYATKDDELIGKLYEHADKLSNALAVLQDESRAIIQRTGEIDGLKIRVEKSGDFSAYKPSAFQNRMKNIGRKRAADDRARIEIAQMQIAKELEQGAHLKGDRDRLPEPTIAEHVEAPPVKDMDSRGLVNEYKSLAGQRSARKKEIEAEIMARIATMPEAKIQPIPDKYADAPLRALERDLFQSIRRGKFDEMKEISNAIAWKKRHDLGRGLVPVKSKKVRKAAKIVNAHNSIGSSDNGVPLNAPVQVRETIKNITNRNRGDEQAARTVAHRLIAILGKGIGAEEPDGTVSVSDLARILGDNSNADTSPAAKATPEFQRFRSLVREISTDLRTDAGKVSAAQKISRLVINATTDPDDLARLGTNGDELAAAFTAAMRQTGSLNDIFDGLPDASRARISEMFRENLEATALVMRGFLSDASKKELQPMTIFGDVLRQMTEDAAFKSASKITGMRGMTPYLAEAFKVEYTKTMSPGRRMAIEYYAGAPAESSILFYDGGGLVPNEMLEGGGAPLTSSETVYGNGVYLVKRAVEPETDAPIAGAPNGMQDDLSWAARNVKRARDRLSRELSNMEMMRAAGEDVSDFRAEVISPAIRSLENATATEAGLWRMARSRGATGQPKVIPFVSSSKNAFDFSATTEYSFGTESPSSLDWLLSSLETKGLVSEQDASTLRSAPVTLTGVEAHSSLVRAISTKMDGEPVAAADILKEHLAEMGFDSIDDGAGIFIFDDQKLRALDDPGFAKDEYFLPSVMQETQDTPLAGNFMAATMEGNVDRSNADAVMAGMQHMGVPTIVSDSYKKIFKREPLHQSDIDKVGFWTRLIAEPSARFRKAGAGWFADKIKPVNGSGFFEKLDSEIASSLAVSKDEKGRPISIITALRNLPDAQNKAIMRWMERNRGLIPYGLEKTKQPPGYDAIVMALRGGDEYVKKLPPVYRKAAEDIQKFFRNELAKAWKDGLPLGFRKNYMPQVWNADAIKADPNAFVVMMRDYFMNEMRRGEVPTPVARDAKLVAEEKAKKLLDVLTTEGGDGVILPDNALRSRLEDHFYERVINLTPADLPQATKFLVNDLEGIIAKYADQITRRRLLTKEFGLGNHAASTYLNVLVNGRDAIVDTLRNTKNFAKQRWASDAVTDQRVVVTSEIISPIEGTEQEVADMVDTALDMLGKTPGEWAANKEKVRNYLINLQDPAIVAQQPEFIKRIDAIVNALAEHGGNAGAVQSWEITNMVKMVAALSKKPVDEGFMSSPSLIKFSNAARAFNSVTLLAFTTLASLNDTAMPLIRSGNVGAWTSGWRKYMADPHYRQMAQNIGVGVKEVLYERMAHMYSDTSNEFSNAFFNLTLLSPWTNMQREVAAIVGFESFKAETKRAQDLLARGMQNTTQYRTTMRYLQRYGLEQYALPGARSIESVDEVMGNEALRYAMMRFTNETIFSPNPNDIPLWAQNPVGQIVFQLKSYPLMMGRMAKYTLEEFKNGNPRPLAYLIAAGGGLGMTSLAVRDVVQRRGDTDGDGKPDQLLRERYASDGALTGQVLRWYNAAAKSIGVDIKDKGAADAVLGWFAESMLVAGGFGLFADLMHTAVEQSDNRDYGKLRMTSWFLGPSFSVATDAVGVAQVGLSSVFSEDGAKNSDVRASIRSVVGRIPIAGGIRELREGTVDYFAPKKKKKKKKED